MAGSYGDGTNKTLLIRVLIDGDDMGHDDSVTFYIVQTLGIDVAKYYSLLDAIDHYNRLQ